MNERIKELAEQSGMIIKSLDTMPPSYYYSGDFASVENLVKLVVLQCANRISSRRNYMNEYADRIARDIKEHFGVE